MTVNGIIICTFTPLEGLSDVVLSFMPQGRLPNEQQIKETGKFVIQITWDDVPHLDEKAKKEIYNSTPIHLREARSQGVPSLGAGAIYPFPEELITIEPFKIPAHWLRAYALDPGWKRTAALWGAYDPESSIWYLYSEHYRAMAEPSVHVESIKARGDWIPGLIDPASLGGAQDDGRRMVDLYTGLGLDLQVPDNALETGIADLYQRFSEGRIKVFSTLLNWFAEFRLYRRSKDGKISTNQDDHLMDTTRYLIRSGLNVAKVKPIGKEDEDYERSSYINEGHSHVGGY